MAKFRNYLKLRGAYFDYTTFTWDTTYHRILYRSDTTLHTDTSLTTSLSLGTLTGTSDASVEAPNCPLTFLYPLVPEEKYVLDGVADGSIVLKSDATDNGGGTFHSAYLDELIITLQRITEEGVVDDLASYTLGSTVASGNGAGQIVDITSETTEAAAEWQYAFPFWLEISAQDVSSDERLRLAVDVYARNWNNTGADPNTLYLIATTNSDDCYVNLPIV